MARDDPPPHPSGPTGASAGDAVLAAIAHRLRARSERQQLLTERLRAGELRPGALADLAELAAAARRGARDGDHILVLAGAPRGPRLAAPPTPLGQALNTVVSASEAASRTIVPPTPSVSVDAAAEPVLGQILAELLAHAASVTPAGERIELLTRWGPEGGIVVELQGTQPPRHRTPVEELDRALGSATPGGPVAPQEIGLHVAARLARAIGARLGVRGPAGNSAVAPIAVLHLPSSVIGGGRSEAAAPAGPTAEPQQDEQAGTGTTASLRRPAPDGAPAAAGTPAPAAAADVPWPPRDAPTAEPERSWPPVAPERDEPAACAGLPRRAPRPAGGIAAAAPFAGSGPNGSGPNGVGPNGFGSTGPGPAGSGPGGPGPGPRPPYGPPSPGTGPSRNGGPLPPAPQEALATEALPVTGAPGTTPPVELFGPFDSEVPVPVDDADDTPIFAAVASAWFREPGSTETTALPVTGNDWRTAGDAEFDAARIRADRVVDLPTTAQGLPQRLPGQAMVPPSWRDTPNGVAPAGSRERQPDRVRNRLSSYQRGLREGRHRAAEDHGPHGPVDGAVNGAANGVPVPGGHHNGHHLDDGGDRSVG
ncbi:hypothetical protein [Pseudonocardia sp. HH130629-09]|uniref:hypothetical protein n=1 Tax=Pseudonocardia sp. HH130629-09 TaxID=1641402 RepID=UPI0006CB725E|nr:hypothetical protein [Pseudonocardia sp. HH130629-09]ALE83899.1 hypothetical protein XF36_12655 [Pseudonocardia sp. HH130629-09]